MKKKEGEGHQNFSYHPDRKKEPRLGKGPDNNQRKEKEKPLKKEPHFKKI